MVYPYLVLYQVKNISVIDSDWEITRVRSDGQITRHCRMRVILPSDPMRVICQCDLMIYWGVKPIWLHGKILKICTWCSIISCYNSSTSNNICCWKRIVMVTGCHGAAIVKADCTIIWPTCHPDTTIVSDITTGCHMTTLCSEVNAIWGTDH